MTKSIMRKYLLLSLSSGIIMGLIFPPFASFFTYYKSPSYQIPFSVLCIIAGSIVGFLSFFIGKITLISAIKIFNKHFYMVSKGDLTTRITLASNDEIGELSDSFNHFIISLGEMIEKIEGSSLEVHDLSKSLSENAESNRKISEQIADASNFIAEGAISQNNDALKVQNQLEINLSKAEEMFQKITDMLASAKNSSEIASRGKDYLLDVMTQFSWVSQTVAYSIESIEKLEKRSNEISETVNVMSQIATQTNLLALNASIEAARAGEQGKGFAIVAEEIGKLAQSSSNSSQSIKTLISDIQTDTSSMIKNMENNLERANTQTTFIERGGDALESILTSVNKNEQDIRELYHLYDDIQHMSQIMNEEITKISSVTSDNAAYCQEVAASCVEQNDSINNMARSVEQLLQVSGHLQHQIDKFIIHS